MLELQQYNESKKCEYIFSCVLLFENMSSDVASQYFQEDVMNLYQRDKKKSKDMLCFLENVDYTYTTTLRTT